MFAALCAREVSARAVRGRTGGFGYLKLTSKTKNARVVIDGLLVGKTPLESPVRLPAGQHTLKIVRKGYTQFLDVVQIAPGDVTPVDIDLIPVAGVLYVRANVPKARVYVDGTYVGIVPVETEALVGARAIRVTKAGYYDYIARVKAVGGRRYLIDATLAPLPVGASPYRPAAPPPPRWYERWYIWAGAAAGVTALAVAVIVPVLLTQGDPIEDFCQGQCPGGGYKAAAR